MLKKLIGTGSVKDESKKNMLENRADSLVDSDIEKLRNGGVIQMYPAVLAAAVVRAASYVAGKPEDSVNASNSSVHEEIPENASLNELLKIRKDSI